MSQRYYQELHKTAPAERREGTRGSLRQYVHSLKSKTLSIANSYLSEFLNDVFAAEEACRFFRTFILRFAFDSNKTGDDSLRSPRFAYCPVRVASRYPSQK